MLFKSHVQVQGVHNLAQAPNNVGNSIVINHDTTSEYVAALSTELNTLLVPPQDKVNAIQAALAALSA